MALMIFFFFQEVGLFRVPKISRQAGLQNDFTATCSAVGSQPALTMYISLSLLCYL
jgi:hypothetical protein